MLGVSANDSLSDSDTDWLSSMSSHSAGTSSVIEGMSSWVLMYSLVVCCVCRYHMRVANQQSILEGVSLYVVGASAFDDYIGDAIEIISPYSTMVKIHKLPRRQLTCEDSDRLIAAHCRKAATPRMREESGKNIPRSPVLRKAIAALEPEVRHLTRAVAPFSPASSSLTKERMLLLQAVTEIKMQPLLMLEAVKVLRGAKGDYKTVYENVCKRWKSAHKGPDSSNNPIMLYCVLSLLE